MRFQKTARFLTLAALAGVAAACSEAGTTEPTARPQFVIDDPSDPFDFGPSTDIRNAYVCVVSPVGGTYTFGISGTQGGGASPPNIPSASVNVPVGTCVNVANSVDANPANPDLITADETAHPGTVQLLSVLVENARWADQAGTNAPIVASNAATDPATGEVSIEAATRITYTYELIPQEGGEGCTPGYWKQSHHFDSWTAPYDPTDLFSDHFEDAFPGMTLVQVLGQGGGGLKALGRHVVAALLNAASGGVDYDMTEQEVIDAFNAVFPGGDYNGLKDELVTLNEQGCPLN